MKVDLDLLVLVIFLADSSCGSSVKIITCKRLAFGVLVLLWNTVDWTQNL